MAKPKLNLIEPTHDAPLPPRKLGVHGMALWCAIQADYRIADAGGLEYLCLACQALDRAEACREQIEEEGQTIEVNGVLKDHPLLRHEAVARAQVAKYLDKLNLSVEPVKAIGRPAGKYSVGV